MADGYNDSIRSIRVRGLPGAGRSINFFGAPGEVDTYIVDRIDVSRGPNSILYGFGSPAGRLNVTTKQAQTNKNAYSFSNRIDDWGGERWTADANLVLIKNKLALPAVTLRGREDSWRASPALSSATTTPPSGTPAASPFLITSRPPTSPAHPVLVRPARLARPTETPAPPASWACKSAPAAIGS